MNHRYNTLDYGINIIVDTDPKTEDEISYRVIAGMNQIKDEIEKCYGDGKDNLAVHLYQNRRQLL